MYHFTDGGLRNVWLRNGYIEHQTPYGHGVSFLDLDGLTIAICQALYQKPGKLSGAEFRYIRTALQFSQKSLGKLFGYTEIWPVRVTLLMPCLSRNNIARNPNGGAPSSETINPKAVIE
ncbi:hypothetical protein [Massilia sp. BJB1822]|uniref:hypothetical protein n=1 Tax=Massilia sp. BJB1822 TaxID=2744470 RepID=UPI001592DA66|nr:hypothetical protein [Massilia sp. BJB1822]NVE00470.1 hypothetical protein [Massilia sp. BJB1822]